LSKVTGIADEEEQGGRRSSEHFDELATLREIERVIRAYDERYFAPIHTNDDRQFHPGTVRMMETIKSLLDHLDEGRRVA
jgi:hypothetical protein